MADTADNSGSLKTMLSAMSALQDMRHAEEQHRTDLASQHASSALELVRSQEIHDAELASLSQINDAKAEQARQKNEIDLATAVSKGIIPESVKDKIPPPKPQEPQPTIDKEFLTLHNKAIQRSREQGNVVNDDLNSYIQSAMLDSLKKVGNERYLSKSPLGTAGALIGGVVNLVSDNILGQGTVGTDILGGKLSELEKLALYQRAMYTTSPLVRTELQSAVSGKRISARDKLVSSGLSSLGSLATSEDDANILLNTRFGLEKALAEGKDTNLYFRSDSPLSIKDAYNAWSQALVREDRLKNDPSIGEADASILAEEGTKAKAIFMDTISKFYADGGTNDMLTKIIASAQSTLLSTDYAKRPDLASGTLNRDVLKQVNLENAATASMYNDLEAFRKAAIAAGGSSEVKQIVEQKSAEIRQKELEEISKKPISPARTKETEDIVNRVSGGGVSYQDLMQFFQNGYK